MNPVRPPILPSNRLIAGLPAADRALIDPHLKEVPLRAREVLHEAQDEIQNVYFPHAGVVSILAVTDDGETVEAACIGHDGAVGAMAALGMRHSLSRSIVQIAGQAARIGVGALQKAAQQSPRIRDAILQNNEMLLAQAQQTAACGTLHAVEGRLARWLLQAQDRSGGESIQIIQEYLAQVLGVRRTTINLVVGTLQQAGAIQCRRGHIKILDRAALMAQTCSCYQSIRRQIDQLPGSKPPAGKPQG